MNDPERERGPTTGSEWLIACGFLLLVIVLLAAEIASDYSPRKFSALFIVLFWIPLLALHEAGHAVVAQMMKWRVEKIVIGMGKVVRRFQLGPASIELRMLPIEGFVRCRPSRIAWPQIESGLIYLAGPGVEAIVAVVVWGALGTDQMFNLSNDYGTIALQSLAIAAASHVVMSLIPFAIDKPQGRVVSDGLGIVLSLVRPNSYYAAMMDVTPLSVARVWNVSYDSVNWGKRGRG